MMWFGMMWLLVLFAAAVCPLILNEYFCYRERCLLEKEKGQIMLSRIANYLDRLDEQAGRKV